jgi:hypothetical protein
VARQRAHNCLRLPEDAREKQDDYVRRAVGDSRRCVSTRVREQVHNAGDDHWEMPCCTSD